jgi:hypothetical protein
VIAPTGRPARDRRIVWPIAGVAMIAIALTYGDLLRHGLAWDDYLALRPRSWSELAAVFHGSWDPRGEWPAFYRPLTVWYYAAMFHIFGLRAMPLHFVSLAELWAGAVAIGVFVARESGDAWLGIVAAALLAVHPGVAHGAAPFFCLQNHLLSMLIVGAALLVWQSRRDETGPAGVWPLLGLAAIGCLVKEDVLLIAPALVAAQAAVAWTVGSVPKPSPRTVFITIAATAALIAGRSFLLGGVGGGDISEPLSLYVRDVFRAPYRVLLGVRGVFFEDRPLYEVASGLSAIWLVAGSWAVLRSPMRHARALWMTGLVLLAVFALALAPMSTMTRYHLVTMGATLMLCGALAGLMDWADRFRARTAVLVGAAVTVAILALASRAIVAPFAPCGYGSLAANEETSAWGISDDERAWLDGTPAACAHGETPQIGDLQVLMWDTVNTPAGTRISDTSEVSAAVTSAAARATIALRPAPGTAVPVTLTLIVDGRRVRTMTLVNTEAFATLAVALPDTLASRLRGLHEITIAANVPDTGRAPRLEFRPIVAFSDAGAAARPLAALR